MSLRIVSINGQYRPLVGGTEMHAARLAREWTSRGHQVEIWTRRLEADHPVVESEGGAVVRRLGWAGRARVFRLRRAEKVHFSLSLFLRLVMNKNSYDVVIVHQALYPAVIAALAACITEQPLIIRIASTGVTSDFRIWGAGTRMVLRFLKSQTSALIVLNEEGGREAVEVGFAPERVRRIPNGIESHAASSARPVVGTRRVVYVGGLRSEKRVDVLLRAWAQAGSPGELLLAGDGPLRSSLEALARELGITPVFLGNVADPRSILREADVFVLPSDAEGMSNALLEAMMEGCACVATFIGGNVDCLAPGGEAPPPGEIRRGPAGWLVNRGDVDALAAALKDLCADAATRARLGDAARRKATSEYSIQTTAAAYIRLFEETMV